MIHGDDAFYLTPLSLSCPPKVDKSALPLPLALPSLGQKSIIELSHQRRYAFAVTYRYKGRWKALAG